MSRPTRHGFTLVELIVVIAIIAIFIGLMLPATRRVRIPAERATCANNLKQQMLALQIYYDNGHPVPHMSTGESNTPTEHRFPPGCFGPGTTPEERLSWMVAILPYMEQEAVYRKFDFEKGYAANHAAAQSRIRVLICPSAKEAATTDPVTNYIAMAGIGRDAASQPAGTAGNGFMGYDRLTSMDMIKDGSSNTIALMETRIDVGPWARGGSSNLRGFDPTLPLQDDKRPFGEHNTATNVAWADGSIRAIRAKIDPQKLAAMITINGGETVNLDD